MQPSESKWARLSQRHTSAIVVQHRRLARAARAKHRAAKAQQREMDNWLKENTKGLADFDLDSLWQETKDRLAEPMLRLVVRYLASAEAMQVANETLSHRMKLKQAGIMNRDFERLLGNLFGVELTALILRETDLPSKQQQTVLAQTILKAFPGGTSTETKALDSVGQVLRQVNQLSSKSNDQPYGRIDAKSSFSSSPSQSRRSPPSRPDPFRQPHIRPKATDL